MPCGGIYPVERDDAQKCWVCGLGNADHFCEEWDTYLHEACVRRFLESEEGQLVIRHRHLVQIGDEVIQEEGP